MTDSKEQLGLLFLPGELRDMIWALVAKGANDGQVTRGIINCCTQTAREMIPHLVPFNDEGGLDSVSIDIDNSLADNVWLSVGFSNGLYTYSLYSFDPDFYNSLSGLCSYKPYPGQLLIESMENPILHAIREAKNVKRLHVVLCGMTNLNRASRPQPPVGFSRTRQSGSEFLIHFAEAMDAARLIGSVRHVGDLTIFMTRARDLDPEGYYCSTPLAHYGSASAASRRHGPRSLDAAPPEPGPNAIPAESFAENLRRLTTVTASDLLLGAFVLEGNWPRVMIAGGLNVGFVSPGCFGTWMTGHVDETPHPLMNGYVDGIERESLKGSGNARYLDLRRLGQLPVKWEGSYMSLREFLQPCLPSEDTVDDTVHHLVDYEHVLDAYASAIRMADSTILPLLRHCNATKNTSEDNFFYRLLRQSRARPGV